jgi:uncharacterized protein (DUF433 family)
MRIRVVDVLCLLEAGLSPEEIIEELPPLERDDVEAARLYAASHSAEELNRGTTPSIV